MILFTGQYNVQNPDGGFLVENIPGAKNWRRNYTQYAVSSHFPAIGSGFVAVSLFFFAFTTIMAYYYMAETNLTYLFRKENKWLKHVLRLLFLGTVFYGSIKTAELAWTFGDIGVGMMAWLNLIAILLLRKPAFKAWNDYKAQRKAGKDPVFKPNELGIKNAEIWNDINK